MGGSSRVPETHLLQGDAGMRLVHLHRELSADALDLREGLRRG